MPYYAIKPAKCEKDICVCEEESIETVDAEKVLGPGKWEVREITEDEANKFAEEWANGDIHHDFVCPICEGPRIASLRGEIVIKVCKDCGFES